jgi:hypothetical protein
MLGEKGTFPNEETKRQSQTTSLERKEVSSLREQLPQGEND